ncbi:MAG TPA: lysozyme inhibitor LprI family protein [Rhodoblastus sp.]|nr:lysozyme inhibitor LprI family protein [Rhodoblastus sp.]
MQPTSLLGLAILAVTAAPAAALDCKAAKGDIDKAICSSPEAAAADESMAAAYNALRGRMGPAEREALLVSQRLWIKRRGFGCDSDKPGYAQCLAKETEQRRAFLEARAESGPGLDSPLVPVIVAKPGKPRDWEIDVELLKFVEPKTPGEKTFNAEIGKMLKDIPTDRSDIQRDQTFSHDVWMRVTWLSPRLISARIEGYDFEGGAHGNPSTSGLNIDTKSGRKLVFTDAFDKAAREKLTAHCLAQIAPEKVRRGMDEPKGEELKSLRQGIDEGLAELDAWNFAAQGATIVYGPYAIGSYAEGSYTCDVPLARLKELAKKDFPLPD